MELREALEGLARPLRFAAQDGFAHLDRVQELGPTLVAACARLVPLVAVVDGERGRALGKWAESLTRFEAATRGERERLVAQGMRLVATVAMSAPAPKRVAPVEPVAVAGSAPSESGEDPLALPISALNGCGPKTAERFAERGLRTVGDLVELIPRRWDDLRALTPLGRVEEGKLETVRARVVSSRIVFGRRRFFEVVLAPPVGQPQEDRMRAVWFFIARGMKERFAPGTELLVTGTPRRSKMGLSMAHPETVVLDPEEEVEAGAGIRVRYPEVKGVPARTVARLVAAAVDRAERFIPDGIPDGVREAVALPRQGEALATLHRVPVDAPPDLVERLNAGTTDAHRRLAFDELFFLQLGLARRRAGRRRERAVPAAPQAKSELAAALAPFLAAVGFPLTRAQKRAITEVAKDLARPSPMHRLLQGDVGAGKTVVAYAAAELTMRAGRQVAVMAPTEILAEQHARTLAPWAKACGRAMALLTASTPRAARESTLALLEAGSLDLVVGTHALLAERVNFARLGLVVIDEQHRFGVAQRALLRRKGTAGAEEVPHLLVMTATPIPRTLALSLYGDLDASVIDELPPGRKPPTTRMFVGARGRQQAERDLTRALAAGAQAYYVSPTIDDSEALETEGAVLTAERLTREHPGTSVGLVHGRLPQAERDAVMKQFRDGTLRLLVATSVIEVGVDVPAATVMLIDGAERFGLAQLHQLRGRIGRGQQHSTCLLVASEGVERTSDAAKRLEVMCETADGFVVAEEDLKLRGPGELYGTAQAGMPQLRHADLTRDLDLLRQARDQAFALLDQDPTLQHHPTTTRILNARWREETRYGEEAG